MQKFFAIALLLIASFSSVLAAPIALPVAAPQTDVEDAVKTLPDGTIVPFDS
ncbi:hypothetical protein TWF281_000470 [Arthrobotrys megalospora]